MERLDLWQFKVFFELCEEEKGNEGGKHGHNRKGHKKGYGRIGHHHKLHKGNKSINKNPFVRIKDYFFFVF